MTKLYDQITPTMHMYYTFCIIELVQAMKADLSYGHLGLFASINAICGVFWENNMVVF